MSEDVRSDHYVIWSNEHRAWWGPDRRGYFFSISSAGRYTRAEAMSIASHARGGWRPGELPPEIALPERDAMLQSLASEPNEFMRTDNPIVRKTGDHSRSCATCDNWSAWIGETGDCLFYAYRRRQLVIDARTEEDRAALAAFPRKAARATVAGESCDGWVAIGRAGR